MCWTIDCWTPRDSFFGGSALLSDGAVSFFAGHALVAIGITLCWTVHWHHKCWGFIDGRMMGIDGCVNNSPRGLLIPHSDSLHLVGFAANDIWPLKNILLVKRICSFVTFAACDIFATKELFPLVTFLPLRKLWHLDHLPTCNTHRPTALPR